MCRRKASGVISRFVVLGSWVAGPRRPQARAAAAVFCGGILLAAEGLEVPQW